MDSVLNDKIMSLLQDPHLKSVMRIIVPIFLCLGIFMSRKRNIIVATGLLAFASAEENET
ncbi:hypothetical protein R6Q57_003784 [Mikania cordata]